MVCFDTFSTSTQDGKILNENKFNLLSYDKEGNIVTFKYNGVYVIVGNGYLPWFCTMPPQSGYRQNQQNVVIEMG
jgi:hypothetical protein